MQDDHSPIEQPGPHPTMEAELARHRAEQRQRVDRDAPKPIGQPLADALNRFADILETSAHPIEQKRQLANAIQARVRCPHMHRVQAERAAEYVVFDGLPLEVIAKLLDELDEAKRKGQLRPYVDGRGGGRGGWFVGVLKKRLAIYGIKPRCKREQQS